MRIDHHNPAQSFPSLDKSDWQQAVLKELKGDDYKTMLFEIDGFEMEPYYSYDPSIPTGPLPKKYSNIRIAQIYDFSQHKNPVAEVIAALNQGLNSPIFCIDDISQIPDEIQLDILTPYFIVPHTGNHKIIETSNNQSTINAANSWSTDENDPLYLFYDAQTSVIEFTTILKNKLDQLTDDQLSHFKIEISLTENLLHNIIKARVIKIVWCNLLQNRGTSITPYLLITSWKNTASFPDEVIHHTYRTIAATFMQADVIILPAGTDDVVRNRIVCNVPQVAFTESALSLHEDPIAGSYFVENIALTLAEKAMQQL